MRVTLLCLLSVTLAGSAGAAPTPPSVAASTAFPPAPVLSVYQPKNARDPFLRPGQEAMLASSLVGLPAPKVSASAFRLQAIFYDARNPAALVNDQEVLLNKIVTVQTAVGTVRVKPVEIQTDRIVLEVEGQRVELRLEESSPPASQTPKTKE